jgi:hypothetical protein
MHYRKPPQKELFRPDFVSISPQFRLFFQAFALPFEDTFSA